MSAAWLVPKTAHATLAEALDLQTLVERSDDVVVARVLRKESRWLGERIVTDVTLEVTETVKGDVRTGHEVEVMLFGGMVGELGMQISGEAGLVANQEYLLFLRRWNGTRRPVGMAQGALPVVRSGPEAVVQPGSGGLSLVRRSSAGTLTQAEPAVTAPRPLDELLDAIRALL